MFRELLEQVRIEGQMEIAREPFLRDMFPINYDGETSNSEATKYYNSGGRAIMFERGDEVVRVKGVDPFGKLTRRVATSSKNRIKNVRDALRLLEAQPQGGELLHLDGKPFGPFFLEQAENEARAFEMLARAYEHYGIQNPCEFITFQDSGIEVRGNRTYQTAFKLPSFESDFRVHEWNSLLAERLDACTPEEIAQKSKNISRLYGRFIYWAGVNAGILAQTGLLPTSLSFVPQNWVIGKYGEGYGIFRVDHTSTREAPREGILERLMQDKDGVPRMINEFSIYAGRTQMAANPKAFFGDNSPNTFSEILFHTNKVRGDERPLIEAHNQVFALGIGSLFGNEKLLHIPEEMFREALA